jgi:glutamate dehydrogenase/leucine dehydrogenase
VQHNLSTGPSKGGIRFHQDVTIGEVAALTLGIGRVAEAKASRGLFP